MSKWDFSGILIGKCIVFYFMDLVMSLLAVKSSVYLRGLFPD